MFTLHTHPGPDEGEVTDLPVNTALDHDTEHDGETTQLTISGSDEAGEAVPSLAEQRTARRHRRGVARNLQRSAARKTGAA